MKGDKNNPIPVKDCFEAIDHTGRWCTYPNGAKVRFDKSVTGYFPDAYYRGLGRADNRPSDGDQWEALPRRLPPNRKKSLLYRLAKRIFRRRGGLIR